MTAETRDAGTLPHNTDGPDCWCNPVRICAACGVRWSCICGPDRPEIIVHDYAGWRGPITGTTKESL